MKKRWPSWTAWIFAMVCFCWPFHPERTVSENVAGICGCIFLAAWLICEAIERKNDEDKT